MLGFVTANSLFKWFSIATCSAACLSHVVVLVNNQLDDSSSNRRLMLSLYHCHYKITIKWQSGAISPYVRMKNRYQPKPKPKPDKRNQLFLDMITWLPLFRIITINQ